MTEQMLKKLNSGISEEFYSSYLYLDMAIFCEELGLKGFAKWFYIQTREEYLHALIMMQYVLDAGESVNLSTIKAKKESYKNMLDVFESALAHEELVTRRINGIMSMAQKEEDYGVSTFIQWFISEQQEEVATAKDIVQRLRLIDNDPRGLIMMDSELGQRAFDVPTGIKIPASFI